MTITLDLKKKRVRIHKQTLDALQNPKYIYLLVNPTESAIAVCACKKGDKDAILVKDSSFRRTEIYSKEFLEQILSLQAGIIDKHTYRIDGFISPNGKIAKFLLKDAVTMDEEGVTK